VGIKQVIVYRRDLNMRKGKIAAQVAHASMKVFFDRGTVETESLVRPCPIPGYEHEDHSFRTPALVIPLTAEMVEWVNGLFTKVVLTVETEADLLRVHELAREAGIPTALITDAGLTEFGGVPTKTAVALGPAKVEDIDRITGTEGAVPTKLS
jgi:PTH2 family peptidyl-tRNA hydrolase